jgi:hypothetical protein
MWFIMNTKASNRDGLPESFLAQFGEHVIGFLSGFDRLRFRATLRPLFQPGGLEIYLSSCRVLIKDFSSFAQQLTDRIKQGAYELFRKAGRPVQYLSNNETSKEALAQELAQNNGLRQGALVLFACVEPCLSFHIRGDRQAKRIRLVLEHSKCTHLYHYYQHPEFGLMHVRVQTWFPFTVDICLNGRQWLAHQMDQAGIAYRQCDNCFVWVEDFVEAQKLLDYQLRSDWPALLQKLLILAHPLQAEITGAMRGLSYYWSASQTEFATDIVFDHAQSLQRLYPHFLLHGIRSFQSPDVLRFLGKKLNASTGKVPANFKGQVTSSLKEFVCVIPSMGTPLRCTISMATYFDWKRLLSIPKSLRSIVQKKAIPRVQKLGASYVGEWLICIAGHKSLKLPTTGTLSLSPASPAQIHCIRKPPVSASQCSITLGVTEPSIRFLSRTTLFYRLSVKASSPSRDYAIAICEPSFTNPPRILCCDVVTQPPSLASSPCCAPMGSYAKLPIHTAISLR